MNKIEDIFKLCFVVVFAVGLIWFAYNHAIEKRVIEYKYPVTTEYLFEVCGKHGNETAKAFCDTYIQSSIIGMETGARLGRESIDGRESSALKSDQITGAVRKDLGYCIDAAIGRNDLRKAFIAQYFENRRRRSRASVNDIWLSLTNTYPCS